MKTILIFQGCRSDIGLSDPVIKRLQKYFNVIKCCLKPQDFAESYKIAEHYLTETTIDLAVVTGDRVEMCAAAAAAFHNKIKIAHFYAGVVNDPITTFDDIDRHCITLWSDIQFTEDITTSMIVWDLLTAVGRKPNVHEVGISHLDDLRIDEAKVPKYPQFQNPCYDIVKPYDLLLFNAEPLGKRYIPEYYGDSDYTIQIGGNPDDSTIKTIGVTEYYPNLPRPQFMGLLRKCQRFITNSSAAIYEAPHFLKPEQIIMVGDRNRNRGRGPFKTGASDKITEILREWLI